MTTSSNQKKRVQKIDVISWNVLNDVTTKREPLQRQRLPEISNILEDHVTKNTRPTIIFLCEVAKKSHFARIANKLDFEIADQPIQYSPTEWMGFITKGVENVSITSIPVEKPSRKEAFLRLETPTLDVFGVHYPHKIFTENAHRIALSKQLIYLLEPRKHTVIVGDFNSLHSSKSRKLFEQANLKQTHRKIGPSFPSNHFRGTAVPRLTPPLHIDAMYYTKKMKLTEVAANNTTQSDHPLIRSSFEY